MALANLYLDAKVEAATIETVEKIPRTVRWEVKSSFTSVTETDAFKNWIVRNKDKPSEFFVLRPDKAIDLDTVDTNRAAWHFIDSLPDPERDATVAHIVGLLNDIRNDKSRNQIGQSRSAKGDFSLDIPSAPEGNTPDDPDLDPPIED